MQIWDDVGVQPTERARQLQVRVRSCACLRAPICERMRACVYVRACVQLMSGEVAGVYSRTLQREAEAREELLHTVAEYEEDIRVLNRAL